MKTNVTKKLVMVLAIAGILGFLTVSLFCAGAATINYTVSGWGPNRYPADTTPPADAPWGVDGYPGDTLEMVTYTGTLNLTPGTYVLKINTFGWTIDYTYGGTETAWDYPGHWSDLSFDITAGRSISFNGGPSGSLSQTMLLENTWFFDHVTINEGDTASFTVGGYQVNVTPLGVGPLSGGGCGGNPWVQPDVDVFARFEVTERPAPSEVWVDDGYCDGCDNDSHTWGYDAFNNIQDGINAVEGSTVNVAAGIYPEQLIINKAGLTIEGDGSYPMVQPPLDDSNKYDTVIKALAADITIRGLDISKSTPIVDLQPGTIGHIEHHAIWDATWTLGPGGLTVDDCIIHDIEHGVRNYGPDLTVTNSEFYLIRRGGVYASGYTTAKVLPVTIKDNYFHDFLGHGTSTHKKARAIHLKYYGRVGEISGNYMAGMRYGIWINTHSSTDRWDQPIVITHNTFDQESPTAGDHDYGWYGPAPMVGAFTFCGAKDPEQDIIIEDNIIANTLDVAVWGRGKWYTTHEGIKVDNNLFYNVNPEGNVYTMCGGPDYWYGDSANLQVVWGGADDAYVFSNNKCTEDPLFAYTGTTPEEYWALQYGSPAIGTASDNTNIGAWQGTPSTTTMTSFLVDDAKFDCKKEDGGKVHVKGELELATDKDISDDVVVTVGTWSYTIDQMEEKGKEGEHWEYKRPKDGEDIIKHMKIDWNKGTFDFEMDGLDLSGVNRPVDVSVQIGDDLGQATVLTSKITEVTIDSGKKEDGAKVRVKGELGFGPVCGAYGSPTSSIIVSVKQGDTEMSWTIIPGDMEVKGKEGESWEYKPDKDSDTVFKHAKVDWKKGTFDFDLDGVDLGSLDLGNEVDVSVTIEGETISQTVLLTAKGKKDQWKPQAVADPLKVVAYPNPIRDVHTARFQVMGTMAAEAEEMRVQIFDLAGRLVWEDQVIGSELDWHIEDLSGRYLANGIYLYSVQLRIGGNWINQDIGKIAVLR